MKKLFLLLLVSALIKGCTPFDIVDEKRMLVKGKIQTASGDPMGEIPIQFITNTDVNIYHGLQEGVIYEHLSSASGEFSFTSFDIKEDVFVIGINKYEWDEDPPEAYETLKFVDERLTRGENLINFGTLELREIINLNLGFINASGTVEYLYYTFKISYFEKKIELYNCNLLPSIETIHDSTEERIYTKTLTNGQNNNSGYRTLAGTQAVLTYRVGDNPPTEVIIPILSEDFIYEITY